MAPCFDRSARIEQLRALMDSVDGSSFVEDVESAFDEQDDDLIGPEAVGPWDEDDDGFAVSELCEDPIQRAYLRILTLCGYHEFSKAAMRKRLQREEYDEWTIDTALAKAEAIGALDDMRWAEMRAYTLYGRGMGQQGIERELRENDIEPSRLDGWPEEYAARYGNEVDRALAVIRKSPSRARNPKLAAYGKLMRKGYSSHVASEAIGIEFA